MFKNIINFFKTIFGSKEFVAFLKQVFTAEKTLILAALKDIAMQAVVTASTTGLSSAAKREQAFYQIAAYTKAKGIEAGDSAINLAIELAVNALKSKDNG